jgi:hypothetical protein
LPSGDETTELKVRLPSAVHINGGVAESRHCTGQLFRVLATVCLSSLKALVYSVTAAANCPFGIGEPLEEEPNEISAGLIDLLWLRRLG